MCSNGACENTIGNYRCICNAGYEVDDTGKSCKDINECDMDDTICNGGQCRNTPGSFQVTLYCNAYCNPRCIVPFSKTLKHFVVPTQTAKPQVSVTQQPDNLTILTTTIRRNNLAHEYKAWYSLVADHWIRNIIYSTITYLKLINYN